MDDVLLGFVIGLGVVGVVVDRFVGWCLVYWSIFDMFGDNCL